MPCSAADTVPATITAGDSLAWSVTLSDYPASAGWTLNYGAACTSPQASAITFAAEANGDSYAVALDPDTTAEWLPGRYVWSAYITGNGQRHTVARGLFEVLPDPAATAVALGHAQTALNLIQAALEGRIPRGLEDTTIDGQQLTRMPIRDLYDLGEKYRARVKNLERAAAAAAGIKPQTTIYVRFRRPGGHCSFNER